MKPFTLKSGSFTLLPVTHYRMEMATLARLAFEEVKPDCVAVELPETMELQCLHAASRLPDISVIRAEDPLTYLMCEPCDASFEVLRSALEKGVTAHCIDLDVADYPNIVEPVPDSFALSKIGHEQFFKLYQEHGGSEQQQDKSRELYMAKRLKELSFSHDNILVVIGMAHAQRVLDYISCKSFPEAQVLKRSAIEICTLSEKSTQQCMAENSWITCNYEEWRSHEAELPDRQKLLINLYKEASQIYCANTNNPFPGYHLRNVMKYVRNYALTSGHLMPDTYQTVAAAKGCVDHNYAYEVWALATQYPHRHNVDGLAELDLTPQELWGQSKIVHFHLKEKSKKKSLFDRRRKDKSSFKFEPPGPFMICSYPPEDLVVENFGDFLKKRGTQIVTEDASRTQPFSTSIEDGIDTRETIRHWHEKKLYVKVHGKPPGGVGSVVVIFDEDQPQENKREHEVYSWMTTWHGEHEQESDMAFYATPMGENVVGPGISRCKYGGFLMSYPPRRMYNIWMDPDYQECRTKAEVLLAAAIDYAEKPLIVYVAEKPPRQILKSLAKRYGKKIIYIPVGQLSPVTLNKIRSFHVLDGHDKRKIADEYIF